MATAPSRALKRWLKQHGAGEKRLAAVLRTFFGEQTARVIEAANSFHSLPPAIVPQLFNVADETELLIDAASPLIVEFMAVGASDALAQSEANRPKPKKSFDLADFELPDDIKDSIRSAFTELEAAPFWKEIQSSTSDSITDVLQASADEGLSVRDIVKRLQNDLGILDTVRAKAVARTEVAAAFNAGHNSIYEKLAAAGLIDGKEWLAVIDSGMRSKGKKGKGRGKSRGGTRPTHAAANGQRVGALELFTVGGFKTPYPGWHGLPARERVNCRCTSAGVFNKSIGIDSGE